MIRYVSENWHLTESYECLCLYFWSLWWSNKCFSL